MESPRESLADGYEDFYREFDSALMRQIRREAYGEDIGQHSWVGAEELRADIHRLKLSPDRRTLFEQVANLLHPGERFLFTDAGVVTGSVSHDEVHKRSAHGYTQFVAAGWNEELLGSAGFRLVETEDRTASVLRNASGRLAAMRAHRSELEQVSGLPDFQAQEAYLETVIELSRRRAVARVMYLAEVGAGAL